MAINFKIHYWPSVLAIWVLVTFSVSYILSVGKNKVSFVPYISELGAWHPASCVFGQFMNITAVLSFIVVYLRYRQIAVAIDTETTKVTKIFNKITLWVGMSIPIGICIIANFQANTELHLAIVIVHTLGATMAFVIGGIYLLIQVKIAFDLRPYYVKYPKFEVSKCLLYVRLISMILYVLNLALVISFSVAALREGNDYQLQGLLPGDDGYDMRLVSVITEWIVLFMFLFHLVTITNELKVLSFEGITFKQLI